MLLFLLYLDICNGIIGAILANAKGRSVVVWFFLCLLMPLVGLILIVGLPNIEEQYKLLNQLRQVNNHHQRWWLEWVAPIRGLKPSIILSFSTYS
jgi:predicted PurR-regulated permease PerM